MSSKEQRYEGLSDKLSGQVLNGLSQSDSGLHQSHQHGFSFDAQKYTEVQLFSIFQDYGHTPINSWNNGSGRLVPLIFAQYLSKGWLNRLLLRIFRRRSAADHQFHRVVFQISFYLGSILEALLWRSENKDDQVPNRIAQDIVAIHSLILSFSANFNDMLYDIIFQRMVMHVYAISQEEESPQWFFSILCATSYRDMLTVIRSIQVLSGGDPRCSSLGFEILRGISFTVSRLVLSRLRDFSPDTLRVFARLPDNLVVPLFFNGQEERVNVLEAVVNEIYGRLDCCSWFLSLYESKKDRVIRFFYELSQSVSSTEESFRMTYQRLVCFFADIGQELGYPVIGVLEKAILRVQSKLLEDVVDILSEKEIMSLLQHCQSDMLAWFLEISASESFFQTHVRAVMNTQYGNHQTKDSS